MRKNVQMSPWLKIFRIEWKIASTTAAVALISILLEGFGIGLILPLLQQLVGGELNGHFHEIIQFLFGIFGLNISVESILGLLIAVITLKSAFTIFREFLKSYIGYNFRRKTVSTMNASLFDEPYSSIIAKPQGNHLNNIVVETQNVAMGLRQFVEVLISISYIFILGVVGFVTDPKLSAISALTALAFFILIYSFIKSFSREVGLREVSLNQALSGQISENISLNKEYRISGRSSAAIVAVQRVSKTLRNVLVKWDVATSSLTPLVELLLALGLSAVILTRDFNNSTELATLMGTLAVFLLVGLRLLQRCAKLTTSFLAVRKYTASLEVILPYLISLSQTKFKKLQFQAPIKFSEVNIYNREGIEILKHVNFEIKPKTFTAFIGSSGTGKSTIIETIIGLRDNFDGQVTISGENVRSFSPEIMFNQVAFISQEISLFNTSLRENILCSREENTGRLSSIISELGLAPLIKRLDEGLNSIVGERGNLLSGGEKQRVLLARCLYADTSTLILDEPTSALDDENEARIFKILEKLKGIKTIILVTHRPKLLELADQVFLIDKGTVKSDPRKDFG